MRLRRCLIILAVILFPIGAGPAVAGAVYDAHTQVELVSDRSVIRPGEPFQAAVRMKMDPGWHVYWQNSGDSGLPVSVQWELPVGFRSGETHWPVPQRFDEEGLATYGYAQGTLLVSDILPPAEIQGNAVVLKADVSWLACERICVPGKADILLSIPLGPAAEASQWQIEFDQARRGWPQPNPWTVTASQDKGFIYFEAADLAADSAARTAADSAAISSVEFYPFRNDIIIHSGEQVLQKIPQGFILSVPKSNLLAKPIDSAAGIFVIAEARQQKKAFVVDVARVPVRKAVETTVSAAPATVVPGISLFWACVFAFIGGLILNLMPCVLPVLSIKVLSLVEHGGERKKAFLSGLVFTLGVLVSFWFLAGLLIALKSLGRQIGWGFQFQSPAFLIALCLILFVFALNLWGLFEINIFFPKAAAYINRRYGYSKAFFSGVLAVVLATPCTAPFMGAAIGFALTQSAAVNFLIFTFLGLGLAFPFIILSAFPQALKFVPRPGPWMKTFKKVLALLLIATIAWLVWVLSYLVDTRPLAQQAQTDETAINWLDYSPELMDKLAQEGKTVFLDFTAKWCINCQVNERITLRNERVVAKFRELGIATVKADWTRFDARISAALAEFGKNSIPLYVLYYGDPAGTVKVLPEIITPDSVLKALDEMVQFKSRR